VISVQAEDLEDIQRDVLENSNDIAYDGIEGDAAINYNSSFGKICTGEQFRVLFTIMNTSQQYSIDQLKMKVIVQRVSSDPEVAAKEKPKEDVLMQETIKVLPAKSQMGFVFIFKVDFQANYFMIIETEYTSGHFSEQLRRILGATQEIDRQMLSNPHYEIDFNRRTVNRKFNKKYKFEAQLPFEVKKSITLKNVSLFGINENRINSYCK
jgi:hypothetical protein